VTDLTLAPYAVRLQWRFARPLTGQEWGALFAEHVELLATRSAKIDASVIGHIKGLAVASGGYARVNLVSPFMPADVECKIPGQHSALAFDLNVLIFGLALEQVKRLTAEAAETVATRRGGQVDIESTHHEHIHV
jgi:hypothetical protein